MLVSGSQGKAPQPHPASASGVSISVVQPEFGFNVIPGSVRRIFATVTNGTTNGVTWAVISGSGTLSSNTGSWVDVTAPAQGQSCQYALGYDTVGTYGWTVTSPANFVVQATSMDDPTQSFNLTFNVCNPQVQVDVVPFYRTLYANQAADVQSMVKGSVNMNVHWAITNSPTGGDGALTDSTSRDAVFSATVPGRYTLTATSVADPSKSSTAIMYVTGHTMPYKVTPNLTEPVDCTVDPALLGTVYDVGPSQTFHTLSSVPFPTLGPGTTVRLHNEDTTGQNPTTYYEYVQLMQTNATATQPFRLCGVPDSLGNLPVMDGNNAVGRSDYGPYSGGYGLITVHNASAWSYYPTFNGPQHLIVEGIKLQDAQAGYSFTAADGTTGTWSGASGAIRLFEVYNFVSVGNDLYNNGLGAYSDFNATNSWGGLDMDVLWEGNHIHYNGAVGSYLSHQLYVQGWNEIVQFNRVENYMPGGSGSNLKSRSLGTVIRYNYMGDGAARQMDMVDDEDSVLYMSFSNYLDGYPNSYHDNNSAEPYTADLLAAAQEEWNSHFVYGNIYQNASSVVPIHFAWDTGSGEGARKGNLYWYNNTFYEELCPTCSGQIWTLFDTYGSGGSTAVQEEWQTVQAYNNVIWMDNPTQPVFQWNDRDTFIGVSGNNVIAANWGSNNQGGGYETGWSNNTDYTSYQNTLPLSTHVTGFDNANLATVSSMPFDPTTWILTSGQPGSTAVPEAVCEMPTRFSYLPSLGYAVPRTGTPNMGATDTVQEIASTMTSVGGSARYNVRNSNCR